MSILAWIEDQKRLKLLNAPKYVNPASDSSKGLWTRCDKCGVILYIKHLKENQRVCFGCSYHLQMSSQERVENLLDKDSWRPLDETVSPCDPLEFHDQKDYTDRLQEAQERTGLQDAIQTGSGMVDGIPIALGVMDFDFMGGSMGSVVGEKVTRLIEYATQEGLTLVLVCASGGARMQEGVFSLMQMAKISSALQVYQGCANLLYISILTSPTTGGVTASFAMLGDIIFAEPKALVAFAGRRVIEQTLCEDLPEDFQTSEYMLHHGLLDLIVPRRFFRQALSESIRLYKNAPFKKPGRIPFGVQNPITFLIEERIRRRWAAGNAPIADKMSHLWTESKSKNSAGAPTPKISGAGRSQEVAETARGSRKNRGVSTPGETIPTELKGKESNPESTVLNRNGSTKIVSPAYAQEGARTSASLESKQGSNSTPGISTPGVSTTSVGGLGGIVDEEEAQTGDKNKQTDNVETPPLAQTQEKLAFKHATQSTESASVDTSLQNEDLARSAAAVSARKSFQNDATFSVSNPLDPARDRPLLQREAIDYRNILTSFQTMFNLFSKELVVPYASAYANNTRLDEQQGDENISGINQGKNPEPQSEQTPYETNSEDWKANSPQEVANFSGVSAPDTSAPDLLLHKFFILSENQNSNQVELLHTQTSDGDCGDTTAKLDSKSALQTSVGDLHGPKTKVEDVSSETPSSTRAREDANYPSTSGASVPTSSHSAALQKTTADISMPTSGTGSQTMEPLLPRRLSVYRDVLPSPGTNKELVGSSSIYVDFLNQSIELAATESVEWRAFYLHQRISQTTGFVEDLAQSLPDYPKHSNEIAFQNMLFYRSICRKLS